MARLWLVGLLLGLLAVPVGAGAPGHAGPATYIVTAHEGTTPNGTVAWFAVDNRSTANPTVTLEPGQRVLLHVVNAGDHNHTVEFSDPVDRTVGPIGPGDEASLSFRVPEDATGSIVYRDPGWAARGLAAEFAVNATPSRQDSPALTPVEALVVVGLAAAGIARRRSH